MAVKRKFTKPLQIAVTPETRARVVAAAEAQEVSLADVMRRAIDRGLPYVELNVAAAEEMQTQDIWQAERLHFSKWIETRDEDQPLPGGQAGARWRVKDQMAALRQEVEDRAKAGEDQNLGG